MAKKKIKKPAKKKPAKKAVKKIAKRKLDPKRKPAKKSVKKASKPAARKAEPRTTTISPYLTFNGTCEEAFNFYKSVFGGKFSYLGRYKEMPPMEGQPPMPESEAQKIMHVSLPISKETILMGADSSMGFGQATVMGNNFAVSISASSRSEADRLYNALSAGGSPTMPMSNTFWGSYFGMLTDRFGIGWMVSYDKNPQP